MKVNLNAAVVFINVQFLLIIQFLFIAVFHVKYIHIELLNLKYFKLINNLKFGFNHQLLKYKNKFLHHSKSNFASQSQ